MPSHLRPKNIMVCQQIPLEDGLIKTKLNSKLPKVVTEDTLSLKKKQMIIKEKSSILESLLINKNLTYKIKSNSFQPNTQITRSFLTSDLVSISKEEDLKPFWNKSSTVMSKKLWLPLKTDSLDLGSSYSKIFSLDLKPDLLQLKVTKEKNNLTMKNLLKTSCLSSRFSQQGIMVRENIQKNLKTQKIQSIRLIKMIKYPEIVKVKKVSKSLKITKSKKKQKIIKIPKNKDSKTDKLPKVCRKIRIYPTEKQKLFFSKCFGTSRFVYNNTVDYVNNSVSDMNKSMKEYVENGCIYFDKSGEQCCQDVCDGHTYFCTDHKKANGRWNKFNIDLSLGGIRKKVLTNDKDLTEDQLWQKDIPYDTRQLIIKDFIGAYSAAKSNRKNGNIKDYKMGFKSRKNPTQIFHINKNAITTNLNLFKSRKIGNLRTRNKMNKWVKKNITRIESDCKIIKYNHKNYYLLLSVSKKVDDKKKPFDIVSLDPGVRTFQTLYSPNGIVGKIGNNFCNDRLMGIAKRIDELDSIASYSESKTRRNIRNRQSLLRTKIKNIVNDLHWKTVSFLCNNFKTIITTPFEVKKMTNKSTRSINNTSVRNMLSLSHYAFRQKLISRAKQTRNRIYVLNESYTSMTCGNCGSLKEDLKGKKTYKCDKCKMKLDRDINGARNIMIRLYSNPSE